MISMGSLGTLELREYKDLPANQDVVARARNISEMTVEEMAQAGQEAAMAARAKIFARGRSVVWGRKGLVVREYPNGQQEILRGTPKADE